MIVMIFSSVHVIVKSISINLFTAYLDIIKYVELLLKNGANVNARNSWGDSALFLAAAKGKIRMLNVS